MLMQLFRLLVLVVQTLLAAHHSVSTNCSSDVAIVSMSEVAHSFDQVYYCLNGLPSIGNNTEIRFYFKEEVLTKTIEFVDITNLSVIGYNHPILRCLNDTEAAGFSFSNVHNLSIRSVEIQNCGTELKLYQDDSYKNIRASIAILNCSNVWLRDITAKKSPGTGVAFFDIEEALTVLDSSFDSNGYDGKSGGNGVYLEITATSKSLGPSIHYNFTRCSFIDNKADTGKDGNINGFSRFDKGGGLCCFVRGQDGVTVTVQSAIISGNTAASYGGGIYASFHNNATNSIFVVRESNYTRNHAKYGGGQYLGYLHYKLLGQTPLNCNYLLEENTFTENWSVYGGGSCIFSTATDHNMTTNTVSYEGCVWRHNTAQFGSAIVILPNAWNIHKLGFLPTFIFSDSTVDSNYADTVVDNVSNIVTQYSQGSGALYCADHELQFHNSTTFSNNNGSALYMGSCKARFGKSSHTTFSNNTGYYGGAIYLLSSSIELEEKVDLLFESNTAYSKGGAIYQNSFNFHMYAYSRTCFFSTVATAEGKDPLERNITVRFIDNFAGNKLTESRGYGHSMYVYSLYPCHMYFRFLASEVSSEIFNHLGNFTYTPEGRPNEIATDARVSHIYCNESEQTFVSVIPGKEEKLPYSDKDDLGHNITSLYLVTVQAESNESRIKVDQAYRFIATNEIKLHGSTNDEGTIVLSSLTSHQRALFFRVKILPCPPGFTDLGQHTCQCAYNSKNQYQGIQHCSLALWRAKKVRGYWMGYETGVSESEDTLATGLCPVGFCKHMCNSLLLPAMANRLKLNKVICSDSRTGVLCGRCKTNTSVHYHSLHFQCKPNTLCTLGWLFYILTEILPATVVFLFIVFFNISFTSGTVNGFIFYSQVVAALRVSAGGIIPFPPTVHKAIQFIYLSFSLTPLYLDELSFCLFENANALDTIAFSYITLVYAFLLVIGMIVLMNKLSTRYCCKAWRMCANSKRETLQGSIIHGLSAFLVLCYAKCTLASILLVIYTSIQGKGSQQSHKVVFYNGEFEWFSKEHLPYAATAIVMSLLCQAPPILLLVYPIHYKVLGFLKIAESRSVRIIFNPLEKMKPLLDSFQGSFKDEFRFFSGLYFLYRLAILVNVTLNYIQDMYFILSGLFLFILLLHMVCQPYKEKRDNTINSLLFLNLAAINGLTAHNLANVASNSVNSIALICWIQTILILLPLAVMLLCVVRKGLRSKVSHCKEVLRKVWRKREPEEHEVPARLSCELDNLDKESSYRRLF